MIVRVLHEGQYELQGDRLDDLKRLDDKLVQELASSDEAAFKKSLSDLLGVVRTGRKLPDTELRESDLIVPGSDFGLEEVKSLFQSQL